MKRKFLFVSLVCFILVLANGLWSFGNAERAFVNDWSSTFKQCKTIEQIQGLPQEKRPDLIVIRRFPNQQWVAAVADSTCSRAGGFDAAVFYDSQGHLSQSKHHFCGYEGLSSNINSVKAKSLSDFHAHSKSFELKPMQ